MRTTVDLDSRLLKRLRAEAHRQGVSFKDLLNRLVRRGLEQGPSAAPEPYRCPTFSMGIPAGALDKALALAEHLADNEAELCSSDSDFARFPNLKWVNPLAE